MFTNGSLMGLINSNEKPSTPIGNRWRTGIDWISMVSEQNDTQAPADRQYKIDRLKDVLVEVAAATRNRGGPFNPGGDQASGPLTAQANQLARDLGFPDVFGLVEYRRSEAKDIDANARLLWSQCKHDRLPHPPKGRTREVLVRLRFLAETDDGEGGVPGRGLAFTKSPGTLTEAKIQVVLYDLYVDELPSVEGAKLCHRNSEVTWVLWSTVRDPIADVPSFFEEIRAIKSNADPREDYVTPENVDELTEAHARAIETVARRLHLAVPTSPVVIEAKPEPMPEQQMQEQPAKAETGPWRWHDKGDYYEITYPEAQGQLTKSVRKSVGLERFCHLLKQPDPNHPVPSLELNGIPKPTAKDSPAMRCAEDAASERIQTGHPSFQEDSDEEATQAYAEELRDSVDRRDTLKDAVAQGDGAAITETKELDSKIDWLTKHLSTPLIRTHINRDDNPVEAVAESLKRARNAIEKAGLPLLAGYLKARIIRSDAAWAYSPKRDSLVWDFGE